MLLVVTLVVLAMFGLAALQIDDWSRDLSINRAATSASHSNLLLRSLELPVAPANVRDAITRFVERSAAWSFGRPMNGEHLDGPPTDMPVRLVHVSRLFQFADDVEVFLRPTEIGTLVDVVSQSRFGKGDFGQNPRNIRELLLALRKHFALTDQ